MIFDRAARDLDVIEWDGVICELLIIFVSFARDQHNVAWPGERNGAIDRPGAIDNPEASNAATVKANPRIMSSPAIA